MVLTFDTRHKLPIAGHADSFEYDLLVFILFFDSLSRACRGFSRFAWAIRSRSITPAKPFGLRAIGSATFVGIRDADKELLEAILEECLLHTLVAVPLRKSSARAVRLGEPLGGLLRLELHIMVTGAHLDLDLLGFRYFYLGFCYLFLLAAFVFKFTIIYDFRNWRDG